MWTNLHFGIVFSGHWCMASGPAREKKIYSVWHCYFCYSTQHCHSFFLSLFLSLLFSYVIFCHSNFRLSLRRWPLDESLNEENEVFIEEQTRKKRIAISANETVEWRKTGNRSSSRSNSSSNKRTKSIDLFTTCPGSFSVFMDSSSVRRTFILFDYIVWHSNNVPIRCACCCVELYCIMVLCAHVYTTPRPQHTRHSKHIRVYVRCACMYVSGECVCGSIGERRKKLSNTNFPFHSFASFTLLISFSLCTNEHIDARTDRRTVEQYEYGVHSKFIGHLDGFFFLFFSSSCVCVWSICTITPFWIYFPLSFGSRTPFISFSLTQS